MKKLLLIICLCTCLSAKAQFNWGVQAGANLSRGSSSADLHSHFEDVIGTGFQAGAFAQVYIARSWYFQPAIQFINKSYRLDPVYYLYNPNPFTAKYSINYVSVPLLFTYQPRISGGKLVFGLGPELNAAVFGRGNLEVNESGQTRNENHKLRFGNSKNDEFRRFVIYPYLLAGYQKDKGLGFYLFGTPGLVVVSSPDYRYTNYLNTYGVSISYVLGRPK
ncbi:MAG TPA: porin family protein [Bacteroidia bacterium]|nr:porin family protein [Bacteroidia bacterium]